MHQAPFNNKGEIGTVRFHSPRIYLELNCHWTDDSDPIKINHE